MSISKNLFFLAMVFSFLSVSSGCIDSSPKKPPPTYTTEFLDVVVIGSGYGGAVSALRLGEAGLQTTVFEKGRRWTVTDPSRNGTFATLESVMGNIINSDSRSTWLSKQCQGNLFIDLLPFDVNCAISTGLMETHGPKVNVHDLSPRFTTPGFKVWTGTGVGGGSLINNGITYRPLREGWELAYDLNEMPYMDVLWSDLESVYFARAEGILSANPIPDDILATPYYENVRIHRDTMVSAGYPMTSGSDGNHTHGTSLMPMIVDWDKVREELSGQRVASVIDGEVWFGNNSDAKNSLDKSNNYIGLAEATGNVDVRPLHTVKSISYDPAARLYTLKVTETDIEYWPLTEITVTTPNLIVSAGSIGTTKLMMHAKYKGELPNLNEDVGTLWSNNGNTAIARVVKDSKVSQGGLSGTKSTNFDDPNAPLVIEILSHKVPDLVSVDPEAAEMVGALLTIAVGVPSQTGTFSWNASSNSISLNWPTNASKNIYDRFSVLMTELDVYGKHLDQPIELAQSLVLHPLGGMPLGLATDEYCGVQGYDYLYAVDASVIPGASALANPTLLITAIAERCMEKVVADIVARSPPF